MAFRITGLSPVPFRHLFYLSDQELTHRGVIRYVADQAPGFPDRIEMRDASVGEKLLLLNHVCQPARPIGPPMPYLSEKAQNMRTTA